MPSNVSSPNSSRTVYHLTTLKRCIPKHTLLSVLILLLKLKKLRRLPKRDGQKQRCPRPKETTVFVRRRSPIYVLLQEKNNFFTIHLSNIQVSNIVVFLLKKKTEKKKKKKKKKKS